MFALKPKERWSTSLKPSINVLHISVSDKKNLEKASEALKLKQTISKEILEEKTLNDFITKTNTH